MTFISPGNEDYMAKAPFKIIAPVGEPHAAPGLRELPEAGDRPLPPGARGLSADKGALEKQRCGRELTEEERVAAAVGAAPSAVSAETATRFRCATTDGLSAIVEKLSDTRYRVQVEKLHRGDAQQSAVEVDVAAVPTAASKGPDDRRMLPITQNGDGTPRHPAVIAFMAAAGIRGSARTIGCTPLA